MILYLFLSHFDHDAASRVGGTAAATEGLAAGLAALGHEVTVISDRRAAVSQDDRGFRVCSFGGNSRHATNRELMNFIGSAAPGLWALNGAFSPRVRWLASRVRRSHLPYVVLPHDPYNTALFQRHRIRKEAYWHLIETRLLQRAAAVQLLDPRHEVFLRERGITTQTIAVPNGLFASELPPTRPARSSGTARFLFLGRIDAYNKGLDLLIQAARIVAKGKNFIVTIQGPDWGDRQRLERMARDLNLQGRVVFADADYSRGAIDIISGHDVLVLPSRFEGFGLSALDAMAAARPVIVSSIGGIAPHVQRSGAGIIVEPTEASIASALEDILSKRTDWHAMGEAGRRYCTANLDWVTVAAIASAAYAPIFPARSRVGFEHPLCDTDHSDPS